MVWFMQKRVFGKIVKAERIRQGLSLDQAAKLCRVSRQYLYMIERDTSSPSIEKAHAVLKGLGLSVVLGTLDRRKRVTLDS